MADIDATLAERGSRYGSFDEHSRITQAIKAAMLDSPKWGELAPDQKEALEMTAHKIGRILNGDPNYHDSWHDIVGYVKLVADRLEPCPIAEATMPEVWEPKVGDRIRYLRNPGGVWEGAIINRVDRYIHAVASGGGGEGAFRRDDVEKYDG